MNRKLVGSGSPFEAEIGFSRAVRVGNHVSVAGTAPIGLDGKTDGVGDVYRQTVRCLEIIAGIRPACTFVEVSGFIDPEWRVEIEAEAIIG
jgi:enamine deaminase RidA (YjgF/YER057c/UK114 family)